LRTIRIADTRSLIRKESGATGGTMIWETAEVVAAAVAAEDAEAEEQG
jgi:hypothetical protein